uniref:Uncharacterized protein n=1 Tax=Anguilla anguilla TaxID=7936 RepID=A0A0E9T568_ANGAN
MSPSPPAHSLANRAGRARIGSVILM